MMNYKFTIKLLCAVVLSIFCFSAADAKPKTKAKIEPGAAQFDMYLPLLKGKRVAFMGNQTSEVNGVHVVDLLMEKGVNIVKAFAPEHGFRNMADAGEKINDQIDEKTGIPIVSLYGRVNKPTPEMLKDVDVMVFDIQDVGARFYTYIYSMQRLMEAGAENGVPVSCSTVRILWDIT